MKTASKVAIAALSLGILFDIILYKANLGLNVLLAEILFLGAAALLAKETGHKLPRRALVAGAFALAYSATFAIWTSSFGLGVAFVGFFISNILFVIFTLGHEATFRHPLEIAGAATVDLIGKLLGSLKILNHLKPAKLSSKGISLIKGVLFLIPLLLIFIMLFSQADAVFGSYVDHFFAWLRNWSSLPDVVGNAIFIGFFTVLFGLFLAAAFWERSPVSTFFNRGNHAYTASRVVLGGLVALFAVFLLVQAVTLFGGETVLRNLDLTYAEYARQGFGQLAACAFIVLATILTVRVMHDEQDKVLRGLQIIFIVETMFVLISAVMRLTLYVNAYGYTPARLFGFWFMATVAVLLVILLVNIALKRDQSVAMRQFMLFVGVSGLMFTASAPDALTAKLNAGRHDPIDAIGLASLSFEAYPNVKKIFDDRLPIEGLITPQPTVEMYCHWWVDGPTSQAALDVGSDPMMREVIDSWYRVHVQLASEQDWRSWNLAKAQLPLTAVDDEQERDDLVPSWVNSPSNPDWQADTICQQYKEIPIAPTPGRRRLR